MKLIKFLLFIGVVAALVLLPIKGGNIFEAVKDKFSGKAISPEDLKKIPSTTAKIWNETKEDVEDAAAAGKASAEDLVKAKEHYMEGLKYFQNGNYKKAKAEWKAAAKLTPNDKDVNAGLKRIEAITSSK